MASCVYFDGYKIATGKEALSLRNENPDNAVKWIKRQMTNKDYKVTIEGKEYTPSEISSFILKKLSNDFVKIHGKIDAAVVSVPAHFDEIGRTATLNAAKAAGLNVIGLINEPTAAALYYALTKKVQGRVLVFDLGGGTFDVTIADIEDSDVNVICSQGDLSLGGYNFDQKIIEDILNKYKEKWKTFPYPSGEDRNEQLRKKQILSSLERTAEDIKITLSTRDSRREHYVQDPGAIDMEFSRRYFAEELISTYVARIEMLLELAVEESERINKKKIDAVLLVGGSSRIPIIKERLSQMFKVEPLCSVNVDECVALGASIHAGLLVLKDKSIKLPDAIVTTLRGLSNNDVCNHSFGIIYAPYDPLMDERVEKNDILIRKNSSIPCECENNYYTIEDNQEAIHIRITQGEEEDVENVKIIAEDHMKLPAGRPAGMPIHVTFRYDKNEIISCDIMDLETQRTTTLKINPVTGKLVDVERDEEHSKPEAKLTDFFVE